MEGRLVALSVDPCEHHVVKAARSMHAWCWPITQECHELRSERVAICLVRVVTLFDGRRAPGGTQCCVLGSAQTVGCYGPRSGSVAPEICPVVLVAIAAPRRGPMVSARCRDAGNHDTPMTCVQIPRDVSDETSLRARARITSQGQHADPMV